MSVANSAPGSSLIGPIARRSLVLALASPVLPTTVSISLSLIADAHIDVPSATTCSFSCLPRSRRPYMRHLRFLGSDMVRCHSASNAGNAGAHAAPIDDPSRPASDELATTRMVCASASVWLAASLCVASGGIAGMLACLPSPCTRDARSAAHASHPGAPQETEGAREDTNLVNAFKYPLIDPSSFDEKTLEAVRDSRRVSGGVQAPQ